METHAYVIYSNQKAVLCHAKKTWQFSLFRNFSIIKFTENKGEQTAATSHSSILCSYDRNSCCLHNFPKIDAQVEDPNTGDLILKCILTSKELCCNVSIQKPCDYYFFFREFHTNFPVLLRIASGFFTIYLIVKHRFKSFGNIDFIYFST